MDKNKIKRTLWDFRKKLCGPRRCRCGMILRPDFLNVEPYFKNTEDGKICNVCARRRFDGVGPFSEDLRRGNRSELENNVRDEYYHRD